MKENRPEGLRTWIEIDKKAMANNYRVFRSLLSKKTKLMAVVKSNAYGHGLADFSKEMENLGADWLAVDSATEALALRASGIKSQILILGYTLPEMITKAAEAEISFTISSFDQLKELESISTNKPKKVHIKADTGMGRQGFLEKDIERAVAVLKEAVAKGHLEIEGLYTHFASAKNPAFPQFTKSQLAIFDKWVKAFEDEKWKPIIHAAATGGAIIYPDSHFDMVRIGIGMYGLWPSKETEFFAKDKIKLEPVLSWKTIVSEVKDLPAGAKIGYDCTEILNRDTKIAVCPIGYWHGFPRVLSSIGRVLIKGKEARVLGRVSMDMIVVDVTELPGVQLRDEVTLIGKDGKMELSADYVSGITEASSYEFITRLNPLIKRFYK